MQPKSLAWHEINRLRKETRDLIAKTCKEPLLD
jgi:hypothetical protein